MEQNRTYTDKIVDEILNNNIDERAWTTFINDKYYDKGFTLIGVRKEKRSVAVRISDNAVNKFDVICAVTLCILSGIVSCLLGDSLLNETSMFKVFFPLITISIVSILFSMVLINMKDKSRIYTLCNNNLLDIEKKLEEEFARAEFRKIIDENYLEGNIFNAGNKTEDDIEIEAFNFDIMNEREDTGEANFGVA